MLTKEAYAWQFLVRQPYGIALWDIGLIEGKEALVILARESEGDVERLPRKILAQWRVGLVAEDDVLAVVAMVYVPELATIYEIWFNYHAEGEEKRRAFELLATQPLLILSFWDRGPGEIRTFTFANNISHFFSGVRKILREKSWTDEEFDRAKEKLMQKHTSDDLWRAMEA